MFLHSWQLPRRRGQLLPVRLAFLLLQPFYALQLRDASIASLRSSIFGIRLARVFADARFFGALRRVLHASFRRAAAPLK